MAVQTIRTTNTEKYLVRKMKEATIRKRTNLPLSISEGMIENRMYVLPASIMFLCRQSVSCSTRSSNSLCLTATPLRPILGGWHQMFASKIKPIRKPSPGGFLCGCSEKYRRRSKKMGHRGCEDSPTRQAGRRHKLTISLRTYFMLGK